jgi:hypothetical protein
MSGPVARWLETFVCNNMCKQYVEVFQKFGYNTLNQVCKLNAQQLLKMGVTQTDMEKIMENVSVLRQTLQGMFIFLCLNEMNSIINRLKYVFIFFSILYLTNEKPELIIT